MRSVEASAKTRKEAIQKGLEMLGAEMHEVQIEILDEGSRGIFGLGARDVRVRLTFEGEEEPKAAPRRDRRQRLPRPFRDERPSERDERPAERGEGRGERGEGRGERGEGRAERGETRPRREGRPRRESRPERGESRGERGEGRGERGEGRAERGEGRAERGEGRAERAERPHRAERAPRAEREPGAEKERAAASHEAASDEPRPELEPISDSRREEAAALLGEVLAKMGFEASVTSAADDNGRVRINVESKDSAILIGRKGRTLEALQYLINRMMRQGESAESAERFVVDVEKYLDRRRESLEEMARNLAEKAKATGRDVRLKPMSPQERRIIHMTLQEDPDVRTFSLGAATARTVVISPKNAARDPGRGRRPGGGRSGRARRAGGGRPSAAPDRAPASEETAHAERDEEGEATAS